MPQPFADLLSRKIEIGRFREYGGDLAEPVAREGARRFETRNAGERNFNRIGDELLDFDGRQARVNGIDLNLVAGDVGPRIDWELGQLPRSEERRVGKECCSTGRYR